VKVVKKKLDDLKRPQRNIRIHSEAQYKEFERSVTMFGQIRPLVVDEDNTILAGNGLYETLLRLGWTEADCYVVSGLSANEKKKLMMADNKIASLGIDDLGTFDAFLLELGDDLDIPGFDEDVLQSMVSDPEDVTDAMSGYGLITEDEKAALTGAAERKDAAMSVSPKESQSDTVATPSVGTAETRRSVTCPKCGELIWL